MKKYITLFTIMIRSSVYELPQVLVNMILWVIRIGLLVGIYSVAYGASTGHLALAYKEAVWSMALYFVVMSFSSRIIYKAIIVDVQTGQLERFVTRPVHYLLYTMVCHLGKNVFGGVVLSVGTLLLLVAMVGLPAMAGHLMLWFYLVMFFVLGNLLSLMMYSIVGLLAIWMEDSAPVYWVVDKLVMILGGAYVPIALLPLWVQNITLYTPFGAVNYITWLMYPNWENQAPYLLLLLFVWTLLLYIGLVMVWRMAEKNIFINGG